MKKLALPLALVLTAARADAVGPSLQASSPQFGFHVNDLAELMGALSQCKTWIVLDKPVEFRSSSDALDLDKLMANCDAHQLVLEGGGDWGSGQLSRLASFPEPLIKAGHSRDWEFRFTGL